MRPTLILASPFDPALMACVEDATEATVAKGEFTTTTAPGESPGDAVYWQARSEAVEFTEEGQNLRGIGTFSDGPGGQASGEVEVTC